MSLGRRAAWQMPESWRRTGTRPALRFGADRCMWPDSWWNNGVIRDRNAARTSRLVVLPTPVYRRGHAESLYARGMAPGLGQRRDDAPLALSLRRDIPWHCIRIRRSALPKPASNRIAGPSLILKLPLSTHTADRDSQAANPLCIFPTSRQPRPRWLRPSENSDVDGAARVQPPFRADGREDASIPGDVRQALRNGKNIINIVA